MTQKYTTPTTKKVNLSLIRKVIQTVPYSVLSKETGLHTSTFSRYRNGRNIKKVSIKNLLAIQGLVPYEEEPTDEVYDYDPKELVEFKANRVSEKYDQYYRNRVSLVDYNSKVVSDGITLSLDKVKEETINLRDYETVSLFNKELEKLEPIDPSKVMENLRDLIHSQGKTMTQLAIEHGKPVNYFPTFLSRAKQKEISIENLTKKTYTEWSDILCQGDLKKLQTKLLA